MSDKGSSKSARTAGGRIAAVALLTFSLGLAAPAGAAEYDPGGSPTSNAVYALDILSGEASGAAAAATRADLAYVDGMRAHHQGALTMSRDYLADPRGANPVLRRLAHAIIANQNFEIAVLGAVGEAVAAPPRTVLDLGFARVVLRPLGVEALEQDLRYMKSPPPGPAAPHLARDAGVSVFDVQWAKAMIVHHRGALDMVRAYRADPGGRNTILARMNNDIVQDQSYEIALLEGVIARYPGDAGAIGVDPAMVHGMRMDGGHGRDAGRAGHGAH